MHALPGLLPCGKMFWFTILPPQLQIRFCVFSSIYVPNKLKVPNPFFLGNTDEVFSFVAHCIIMVCSPILQKDHWRDGKEVRLPISPGCWFRSCFPVQSVSVSRFVVTVSISKCAWPGYLYSLTEICYDYSELYLSLKYIYIQLRVLLKSFE